MKVKTRNTTQCGLRSYVGLRSSFSPPALYFLPTAFSGPDRAIGPVYEPVCVSVIIFIHQQVVDKHN